MTTIIFEKLTYGYRKNEPIFENIDLVIKNPYKDRGYVSALMGNSGVGKSTLLKLILGIEKPLSGSVYTNNNEPIIAYLPQEPVLFDHLSPFENARYFSKISAYKKYFDVNFFEELTYSLNMESIFNSKKKISELSGGQKQRISLIRALSINPEIILLDEPTTGLDANVKLKFLTKLREIVLKQNILVLYITHNRLETELIVDEVIYIPSSSNKVPITKIYQSSLAEFIKNPPIVEAAKIFNYPKQNLIEFGSKDNELKVSNTKSSNNFILQIEDKNITFCKEGIDFEVVSQNPLFSLIEIGQTKQQVTLNKINSELRSFCINGEVLKYNLEGILIGTINITNNKINAQY